MSSATLSAAEPAARLVASGVAYSDFASRCKYRRAVLRSNVNRKFGRESKAMILPVTLTMAAAAVFLHIWLALRCSRIRIRDHVSVGHGSSDLLLARMRAHGNFSENIPLFLILLGLVELSGSWAQWLWIAGLIFILARIAHAIGMERTSPNAFRAGGMLVTLVVLAALAVSAIILSYQAGQSVMIG